MYAEASEGEVVVDPEFAAALADIEGFERLWLLYALDRAGAYRPRVMPYRDTVEHGLFATRSPCRPNPIGLSVARLLGREGNRLRVAGLDILDGTPLLDIKPYGARLRRFPRRAGGLVRRGAQRARSRRWPLPRRGGAMKLASGAAFDARLWRPAAPHPRWCGWQRARSPLGPQWPPVNTLTMRRSQQCQEEISGVPRDKAREQGAQPASVPVTTSPAA